MKRQLYSLMIAALLTVAATPLVAAPIASKDSSAWWELNYGRVSTTDEPLVARAEQVFSRMTAAADSSSARLPRLLVLKSDSDPWVAAIPDGTVLLSKGALSICYRGVQTENGDARLAFILGHELAHQAKNDFWHADTMANIKNMVGSGDKKLKQVSSYIEGTSDLGSTERAKEIAKVKELQADGYGIVYMTMAGYDPKAVIDKDGTNFIEEFVSQVTGKSAYEDNEHPSAADRAAFLRSQLSAVADETELFRIGVRFYQQGRYADAIPYFDRFRTRFPSREVFNNLGLSWYQIAVDRLAQCNPADAYAYKLPALLDTETLADATRGKGTTCRSAPEFIEAITEAVKYLESACSKDARYLPARINLASAWLLYGQPVKALSVADDARKLAVENPDAALVYATALYEFGKVNKIDVSANALALLAPLAEQNNPYALYNTASIEKELGKTEAAQTHLTAFLAQEPVGPYATIAARLLNKQPPKTTNIAANIRITSPIPTGELQPSTATILKKMPKRELVVGSEKISIFRTAQDMALLSTDPDNGTEFISFAETTPTQLLTLEEVHKKMSTPRKVITTPFGTTCIYKDLSIDIIHGQVRSLIFFAPR